MPDLDPARVLKSIRGSDMIADLFAQMFRWATVGLSGSDIARLLRVPVGDVTGLDWLDAPRRHSLSAHVDAMATRDSRERLRLRGPERDHLVQILGGPPALGDARVVFSVAYALDERYQHVRPRVTNPGMAREVPPRFLGETTNRPPPLGQMAPLAACRRWMRAFWYSGDARGADVFGPLPTPRERTFDARTTQALQGAVDAGELRITVVSWKRHDLADLQPLSAAPGCFAFGGLREEPTAAELTALVAKLRELRPHVALFPEISFSETAQRGLSDALAAAASRFPVLTVVGRAHSARPSAGFDNVALVLGSRGDTLLSHEKLEPFQWTDKLEDILPRTSTVYEYADTPIGRLVVNVCRDVRSDIPMLLNRILGVSLLLVPAYSSRLDFVLEEARVLGARQLAIVAAANAPATGTRDAAAFYAPIRGSDSSVVRDHGPATEGPGTAHSFSIRLGKGGAAELAARPPVAV